MNDLISRADAIEAIPQTVADMFENCRNCGLLYREDVVRILSELPPADAVQGEWIITKEGEYDGRSVYKTVCSECGHETFYKANKAHFCPNCGERMKGGEDEE